MSKGKRQAERISLCSSLSTTPLRPFPIPSVWRSRFVFSAMYACGCMRRQRGIRKHTERIVSSPVALSAPAVSPSARSDWQGVRQGLTTLTDSKQIGGAGLIVSRPRLFSLRPFPRAVLFCRYYEHQFDIRGPVAIVFVLCVPSDDVVLRLFCVVYFSTVEKVESSYGAPPGVFNI